MGDSLREAAFDVSYRILGDVGEAEDCASDALAQAERRWGTGGDVREREAWVLHAAADAAMAKVRRSATRPHREVAAVGAAALVLFVFAAVVAVAGGQGHNSDPTVRAASVATSTTQAAETTTSTAPSTTTTVPQETTTSTATTLPVIRATPTSTTPPARTPAVVAARPQASVHEVFPPARDPARVYISARGTDADSYVRRMTLDWGDGTAATNFDYPPSDCRPLASSQTADINHRYAATGTYTVHLIVTSVGCDGGGAQTATAETTVNYSSSPSSG